MRNLQRIIIDGVVFHLAPSCCEALEHCLANIRPTHSATQTFSNQKWFENRLADYLLDLLDRNQASISADDIEGLMSECQASNVALDLAHE